jgi:AraC family transcriptional regulator
MAVASEAVSPEPRRRSLFTDSSATITLSFYQPSFRQTQHSHADPSVALLLSGAVDEEVGVKAAQAESGAIGIKAAGLRHGNVYGPQGAILLTLTVHDPRLWRAAELDGGWAWAPAAAEVKRLVPAALGGRLCFGDLVPELLALRIPDGARPAAPLWLRSLRARLHDEPDLKAADLAAAAGVNRVHLSRSFARCFGESLSAFRLRRKTELAVSAMLHDGMPPALAASEAGFADQSHFARTVRRLLGHTPGQLRSLTA